MLERDAFENHDQTRSTEEETPPYLRTARFTNEKDAYLSYQACQRLIRDPDVDLSAYRFQLDRVWHVAALGPAPPPEEIGSKIDEYLSRGEAVTLPPDIPTILLARRRQILSPGMTWFEGHYHPGGRL